MKRALPLLMLFFLIPLAHAQSAAWKEFRADGFKVSFPGDPETKPNDSNTGTRYFVSQENGNIAYFVEVATLPSDLGKSDKQVLDDYRDGAAKGVGGKVTKDKSISLGGVPGRELQIETKELVMTIDLYLVKNKLFQVLGVATRDLYPADTRKFLDGFAFDDGKAKGKFGP